MLRAEFFSSYCRIPSDFQVTHKIDQLEVIDP